MNAASLPYPNEAADAGTRSPTIRASPRHAWPIAVLGIPFENVTTAQAVERIAALVGTRRPHRVITANADLVMRATRDSDLRQALLDADLVLCDSPLLCWASRSLGNPLPGRISSARLVAKVARAATAQHWKVGVVDARRGAARAFAERLQAQHAGLDAVGYDVPSGADSSALQALTRQIRAAGCDLLLVSVESPAQGKWLAPLHRDVGVPVCIELGVPPARAFPRLGQAGSQIRAARATLRHVAHLIRSRARTARAFAPAVARQWRRMVSALRITPGARAAMSAAEGWVDVDAGECLTRSACDAQFALWRVDTLQPAHCAIDASRVQKIDATGLALLARWRATLTRHGRQLVLVAPSEPVRTALIEAQLVRFFTVAGSAREARELVGPLRPPSVRHGQTRSLAWCGEIIAANVDDVWQMTSQYVQTFAASGATLVIVDLTRLRFVDAAGAALMLRVKHAARELGAEILFVHSPPQVVNVLRAAAIDVLLLEGGQ